MPKIVAKVASAGSFHKVLIPLDQIDADKLSKCSIGQEVVVSIKCARNIRAHRLMFALCAVLADNGEWFPSPEAALDAIKIGTGHCETWINPSSGVVSLRPRSIAFENMDQIEFGEFLSRAVSLVCGRWLVGVEHAELLAEVNQILDGAKA